MQKSKIRKLLAAGCLVLVISFGITIAQYILLPTGRYYRRIIQEADTVELRASAVFDPTGGVGLATITDPHEKSLLAGSIRLHGLWLPFLEVADGRTFHIRTIRSGEVHDIIVRGDENIRHGRWLIEISPTLMDTFRTVVQEHGGHIPEGEELLQMWQRSKQQHEAS